MTPSHKFPVNSTSVITPPCHRFCFEVMQRSTVAKDISFAGVFNCRHIAGSSSWSQHSFGNATDLFADEDALKRIAQNVVRQATTGTPANKGKRVPAAHVIWAAGPTGIWTPERGWHAFTGYHPPTHVHVDFNPQKTGTPECAR